MDFSEYLLKNKLTNLGKCAREIHIQLTTNGPYAEEIKPFLNLTSLPVGMNADKFWQQYILFLNERDYLGWWKDPQNLQRY